MGNVIEEYGDTVVAIMGIMMGLLLLGACWSSYQQEVRILMERVMFR
jgi:hypothetical protein